MGQIEPFNRLQRTIIILIIILLIREFFTPDLAGGFSLESE